MWTDLNPVSIGSATKKSDYDKLWDNVDFLLLNTQMVYNLKPVVNVAVNKLDVFTKSGGAVPNATNIITVAIPDGIGYTFRSRAAAYLAGTSQFVMADAANYWSKGSLDAEIKNAYVYAIWDGTGIVWALGGYSGFTSVPASTTAGDDDFFLLEASSTYTKVITDYCVCVGKIRYQYDTADTPDHTIQATVLDAPQITWNPRSDYGYSVPLAATQSQGSDIAESAICSIPVKQSGKYYTHAQAGGTCAAAGSTAVYTYIKTGSATYGSAVLQSAGETKATTAGNEPINTHAQCIIYLNVGDVIHQGASVLGPSGTRALYGGATKNTIFSFYRID
jgi:hypothetical protein